MYFILRKDFFLYNTFMTLIPRCVLCLWRYCLSVMGSMMTFLCIDDALRRCSWSFLHRAIPRCAMSSPFFCVTIAIMSPSLMMLRSCAVLRMLAFGMYGYC